MAASLDEYRTLVASHSVPPTTLTPSRVRWVNRAADRLRKIALAQAKLDPSGAKFGELLQDRSSRVQTWAAHHILELFAKRSPELERSAIAIIERASQADTLNGLGERMWLKEWREKQPAG